jgi:hypothetical protein
MGDEDDLPLVDNALPVEAGPSLDESLNAAFDNLAKGGETEAEAAQRLRDEQGRFAAKPDVDPAKAAETGKVEAIAPAAPTAAEMPASWSRKAELFAKAPPELQAAIAERESEMARGVERFKGLAEYADMAEKNGLPLSTVMASYIEAERILASDFLGGVKHICQQFGVDPAQLASALSGAPAAVGATPQGGSQPAATPSLPPEFLAEFNGLKSSVETFREQSALTEIQRFSADPANKHFEAVAPDIVRLIKGARAMGDNLSLDDAYKAAIYANPTVRAQLQAEQKAKEEADRIATARAAATTARRAGKSLAPTGVGTPSAPAKASLDEQLSDAWDRLSA